jgi:ABC-type Fe3+ transport system substrate-binding protein
MIRNLTVLFGAALVVALPFVFRQHDPDGDWRPGDPELTIVTPHNEAIRYEFGHAFSAWHRAQFGRPVHIEWLNIGGTTEISRYLVSEFTASARAWWRGQGKEWPAGAAEELTATKPDRFPELHAAFRAVDDPRQVTARIDLFFGGGEYDHQRLFQHGLTVPPWPGGQPPFDVAFPERISGETWRTPTMWGTALSTFGICYNRDRLRDLGVKTPPAQWRDLADPVYRGQVGVADPTKSGSIAKAFEMIIHQQIAETVRAAGYSDEQIHSFERAGTWPDEYQAAVEAGWLAGLRLVQLIGANARYFTDSASKVPIDVAQGDAAVGLSIDFYARFQAQMTGGDRMVYLTPVGGSSVSADPIGLLRGAPNRETAVRFIEFVLSRDGQALWNSRPGQPCSRTQKFALRRLPIRQDMYPQDCAADDLMDPTIHPYELAKTFTYRPRWTSRHFNVQRDLIRAMCLDSADELRAAWRAIVAGGGPTRQPAAMERLQRIPVTWSNARQSNDRLTYLREWTGFFRENYRAAAEAVR